MSRAQEFYQISVIRIRDENCNHFITEKVDEAGVTQYIESSEPTSFSLRALSSTFVTWILIFLCVFKGVKSSSWIVWITVPLPVLFVFIMIINGATLEGAGEGVKMYFGGKAAVCNADDLECAKGTTAAEQWSDAAGQIFLGLSVCLGIMTSYGSYNDVKKPIIMDSVIISVCNCSFSFIAGFAVWCVVGYLKSIDKLDSS